MNFKEGMRRVALLVGVLGAAFGCFASYVVSRDALAARERHRVFELLATSEVVQQERISWLLARLPPGTSSPAVRFEIEPPSPADLATTSSEITSDMTPEQAIEKLRFLPEEKQREVLAELTPEERKRILDTLNRQNDIATSWKSFSLERREELLGKMTPEQKHRLRTLLEKQMQQGGQDPYEAIANPISEVNKGGIKTIHWAKDLGVESIETESGATLYPTPAPTRWPYFLAAIFPVLGFFIPWASVRAVAWVGVGFSEKSE